MSQYCIWFYEIQIQLNVLYFYSQNLATPRITPKLRNWHQYNIENWTIDLIPFSPFLYVCLCRHIHSLLFFFFSYFKSKNQKNLRIFAMQSSPQPHLVTAWCSLGPVAHPRAWLDYQNWWKPISSDLALV